MLAADNLNIMLANRLCMLPLFVLVAIAFGDWMILSKTLIARRLRLGLPSYTWSHLTNTAWLGHWMFHGSVLPDTVRSPSHLGVSSKGNGHGCCLVDMHRRRKAVVGLIPATAVHAGPCKASEILRTLGLLKSFHNPSSHYGLSSKSLLRVPAVSFHSAIALLLPALYRQVMTEEPTCWPADNGRQDKSAIRSMPMV